MTFSRSHVGMIGIISLFTGMIAPVFGLGEKGYPFPLTSIQPTAYIILFLLALSFYLVSTGRWQGMRIIAASIVLLFIYIVTVYLRGDLYASRSVDSLNTIEWGIFFILIGIISLAYSTFTKKVDTRSDINILSDTIIGIVGTLTLLGLSSLIIAASIGTKFPVRSDSILGKIYGSGAIYTVSGVTMTMHYKNIQSLIFERKDDLLSYIILSESGGLLYPEGEFYSGSNIIQHRIGKKVIIKSDSGKWLDNINLPKDTEIGEGIIKIQDENGVRFVTKSLDVYYTGVTVGVPSFGVSEDGNTIAWTEKTTSGTILKKNGEIISNTYRDIVGISLSKNGKDIMAIGLADTGERHVLKNGVPIETIRKSYKEGTWKSNGIHNAYIAVNLGLVIFIYDGVSIGEDFDEIRDIFLEKNGNSYAFFGKKKGENTYCFITRFKGSICGLEGYMNPGIGADGSTIIYAGLKNGRWSLYRNTDTIIGDTLYTRTDISGDYLFYDKTNPKQYLFIEKIGEEQYQLRKNGKLILGTWKDVGLDVGFGYDSKMILSARDDQGWRIIEL